MEPSRLVPSRCALWPLSNTHFPPHTAHRLGSYLPVRFLSPFKTVGFLNTGQVSTPLTSLRNKHRVACSINKEPEECKHLWMKSHLRPPLSTTVDADRVQGLARCHTGAENRLQSQAALGTHNPTPCPEYSVHPGGGGAVTSEGCVHVHTLQKRASWPTKLLQCL